MPILPRAQAEAAQISVKTEKPPKENDYQRRKERDSRIRRLKTAVCRAEEQVAQFEAEITQMNEQLNSPTLAADYAKLTELTDRLAECNRQLEESYAAWESTQQELDDLLAEE